MTRTAIYARFSSDKQNTGSVRDQIAVCQQHVDREAWKTVATFSDEAVSGATRDRRGYRDLRHAIVDAKIDIIMAESLDRLSRDQEETANFFKLCQFHKVRLFTLSEGWITELHVGLSSTINAVYLRQLAEKTHRGLEGRVRQGKSGGGKTFGYDVVQQFDTHGELMRGGRRINQEEAEVVIRIFTEYADGRSPRAIAFDLNKGGIPAPQSDKAWSPSTIYGNWQRGTGVLNNELYIGQLVWNRQHFIKDPDTGKRQARLNPPDQWVRTEVPDLRIIPDDLWLQVKARQGVHRKQRPERARRPTYLLSGLLICGECGGGFSMISANHYGCSRARNTGTCGNRLIIRRDTLEALILDGLRQHLMQPAAVKAFVDEFTREINRKRRC